MGNGPRYKVQTRYGWFSLDEGSYRDYISGKMQWINWPPLRDPNEPVKKDPLPPNASPKALELRDRAAKCGVLELLRDFETRPASPCKERMHDLPIYEMNLTVRSSNGLMRAGIQSFGSLAQLIQSENGIMAVRNLGAKSVKEIQDALMEECYTRLLPYEKAEFWQEVLDKNLSS